MPPLPILPLVFIAALLWGAHAVLGCLRERYSRVVEGVGKAFGALLVPTFAIGLLSIRLPYEGDGVAMVRFALFLLPMIFTVVATILATIYAVRLKLPWVKAFGLALCETLVAGLLTTLAGGMMSALGIS